MIGVIRFDYVIRVRVLVMRDGDADCLLNALQVVNVGSGWGREHIRSSTTSTVLVVLVVLVVIIVWEKGEGEGRSQ